MVGVGVGGPVRERHLGAHVIERRSLHAGNVDLHVPAIGRRGGDLPGFEPVAGGGSELDAHLARRRQVERVLRHQRIAELKGTGNHGGLHDGHHCRGIILLRRAGERHGDSDVFALRDGSRGGVISAGADSARGRASALNPVHEPLGLAASRNGGVELKGLPRRQRYILRRNSNGAALAAAGRRTRWRRGSGVFGLRLRQLELGIAPREKSREDQQQECPTAHNQGADCARSCRRAMHWR